MRASRGACAQTGLPARRCDLARSPFPQEWRVAVGAAALLVLGFGIVYSMPSLHIARHAVLGGSTADLGVVFSTAGAFYYALGPISGRLADRYGAARIVFCGMLVMALGLAASSFARSSLAFDLAYGIGIGFGMGFAFVPTLGAVQRFCESWRASATGIASLGLGLGALIAPPAAAALAGWIGPARALEVLAGIAVLGSACSLLLCPIDHRRERFAGGMHLFGATPRRIERSPAFVRLYASSLCFALAAFVPFAHLPSIAEHMGWTTRAGALLVGAIGLGSTAARLALGWVVHHVGARHTLAIASILLTIGLCAVPLSGSFAALAVSAVVIGLGYGGGTAALPPLVAEIFGTERISEIVGDMFTARSVGILVGPALTGLAFERLSTFAVPFLFCALSALASALWLAPFRFNLARPADAGCSDMIPR